MAWMGIHDPGAFTASVLVFLAIPGPGTFTLLASTANAGVRGGYAAMTGLLLGDQILIWLAVAGVAALLAAHPVLLGTLQWAGVLYLAWVGLSLLRPPAASTVKPAMATQWLLRRGLLVTLLNPNAILFYMAFFPLFIDPATQRGLATFATMAGLIALLSVAYCSALVLVGAGLRQRLAAHPRAGTWLRRLAGAGLMGSAFRLALPQ